jgi:hypothetical protein
MIAAGVYTVWEGERFVYVGMAGRGLTAEGLQKRRAAKGKRTGLFDRLNSHASGRRSGDQFCVYVCDRLILPTLTTAQLRAVGEGTLKLDDLVKRFIRERLSYRFVEVSDGAAAEKIERTIRQKGLAGTGRPLLQYAAGEDLNRVTSAPAPDRG